MNVFFQTQFQKIPGTLLGTFEDKALAKVMNVRHLGAIIIIKNYYYSIIIIIIIIIIIKYNNNNIFIIYITTIWPIL